MSLIINRKDAEKLNAVVSHFDIDKDMIKIDTENILKSRGYILHDGDVVTINGVLLQFFRDEFHEVELKYGFKEGFNCIMPNYTKTGKIYKLKEVEDLDNG